MCHSHVLCGLDGHLAPVSKSIYAAAKKIKSAEASAGLAVKSDENNDNLTTQYVKSCSVPLFRFECFQMRQDVCLMLNQSTWKQKRSKVSLSMWHLEKRCHGEVSQDILWRLKKSAEVNRFELSCVFTKYKTLVWSATKIEILRKSLLISIFWQNQHAIETKIICTCVHLNSAAWFLTFVILNIHDSHHESKLWWSQAFPDISSSSPHCCTTTTAPMKSGTVLWFLTHWSSNTARKIKETLDYYSVIQSLFNWQGHWQEANKRKISQTIPFLEVVLSCLASQCACCHFHLHQIRWNGFTIV